MGDAEKYEAQGRAHAGLKEAKANAATAHASLLNYSKRLEETNAFLKAFLSNPLSQDGYITPAEVVKSNYRNLTSSTFESNVDELVTELKRAKELQEQIDKF